MKSREELGFLLLLADEVDRLNSVVSERALTPGADLFCSSASGWSDLVDPAVCSPDRKVIEAAFEGASSGDIDSLVQIEELCHLDPSRAMSLISSGIDAGSHAVLRHLCDCRSKIGELMERHQLFELQWFSRWISRLFASIAKRSLGVICLTRGHRLVQNEHTDKKLDCRRDVLHEAHPRERNSAGGCTKQQERDGCDRAREREEKEESRVRARRQGPAE